MRTVYSSIMAALVVVALFWGNCFSCPQALLAQKANPPAHQCCHKTKSSAPSCGAQSLQHYVKADSGNHTPVLAVVALEALPEISTFVREAMPATPDYTPPDLFSLNSSYRI